LISEKIDYHLQNDVICFTSYPVATRHFVSSNECKIDCFPDRTNVPELNHYNNKNLQCHKCKECIKKRIPPTSQKGFVKMAFFDFAELKDSNSNG